MLVAAAALADERAREERWEMEWVVGATAALEIMMGSVSRL